MKRAHVTEIECIPRPYTIVLATRIINTSFTVGHNTINVIIVEISHLIPVFERMRSINVTIGALNDTVGILLEEDVGTKFIKGHGTVCIAVDLPEHCPYCSLIGALQQLTEEMNKL